LTNVVCHNWSSKDNHGALVDQVLQGIGVNALNLCQSSTLSSFFSFRASECSKYDGIVFVGPTVSGVGHPASRSSLQALAEVDDSAEGGLFVAPGQGDLGPKRIVFSGTGLLDKDYHDVRW